MAAKYPAVAFATVDIDEAEELVEDFSVRCDRRVAAA